MISKLGFLAILMAASVAGAVDNLPPAGSYGFNWLDPESGSCKQLTAEDLAAISECSLSDNAFGLELESHVCKVNSHVELMVYKSEAECNEAFETMQANGP